MRHTINNTGCPNIEQPASFHILPLLRLRKRERELETYLAVAYRDVATVEENRILDNRETQARTAKFTRAALVDTIETLKYMANMLRVDTDTVIGKGDGIEVTILGCQLDKDITTARIGNSIISKVLED